MTIVMKQKPAVPAEIADVQRRIARARIKLLFNQPFFGSIAMKMGVKITDQIKTMAVDGRDLFVNPEFAASLSEEHTIGVLCHEVLHIANLHHLRKGARDHARWNVACDQVINPVVLDAGMGLPADALNDPQYRGMAAERVYDLLPDDPPGGGGGEGDQPGGFGEVLDGTVKDDGTKMSEAERQIAENEVKVMVAEAAEAARQQGKLPAAIAKLVGEMLEPSVNWREVLRRFLAQTVATTESWSRPNRRVRAHNIRLPGLVKRNVGPIVFAVDTSGSIYADENMLTQFCSEIAAAAREVNPERIHVVFCDAEVKAVEEYAPDEMPDIYERIRTRISGGGGTRFWPVFEWIEAEGIQPAALVYLTDMEGQFPDEPPTYPVLWAKTTKHKAPFGDEVLVRNTK